MSACTPNDSCCGPKDQDVEVITARAFQQAGVHMRLLRAIGPEKMKFGKMDDEIYKSFRDEFPEFNVRKINEGRMKGSEEVKNKWKKWSEQFSETVQEWDSGVICRKNSEDDYSKENIIFCLRVQFLAIEIARNREGNNRKICEPKKTGGCCGSC